MKFSNVFNSLAFTLPRTLPRFMRTQNSQKNAESSQRQQTYLRLFQVMRAHKLMWLQVEGDDSLYQTVVLHVDAEEPFMFIDEPFPVDGVLAGLVGEMVTLSFNDDGQQQSMRCRLLGKAGEEEAAIYQLSYPETMSSKQRRETYRLPVDEMDHISIATSSLERWLPESTEKTVVDSVVLDISAGGLRWAVKGNHQLDVHAGKMLPGMDLSVLGCGDICVDFDVSYSKWVPALGNLRSEHTIVGGSFVGLEPKKIQQLERYITLIQRQQRRDRYNDKLLAA